MPLLVHIANLVETVLRVYLRLDHTAGFRDLSGKGRTLGSHAHRASGKQCCSSLAQMKFTAAWPSGTPSAGQLPGQSVRLAACGRTRAAHTRRHGWSSEQVHGRGCSHDSIAGEVRPG